MVNFMKCPLCNAQEPLPVRISVDSSEYLNCAICGLVWLDPMARLPLIDEKERYLQHNNYLEDPSYIAYQGRLALPVAAKLRAPSHGLDFGSGPVEGMRAVLEPLGHRVESYDPVFRAQKELLNFRYSFVLCSEAAEHFYDPAKEFSTLNSILEPGGILGISSRLLPPLEAFPNWSYRRDPTHVSFYAEKTVHWLAEKFRWEVLELDSPIWIFRKI
jgi:Zn-finger nucleic acid-binding protein